MLKITPVILSGGTGSRLWPSSRSLYPKQFLKLLSNKTLLQETASRIIGMTDLSDPIIVSNQHHRFLVAEQLMSLGITPKEIILESEPKNTAPAICLAALSITRSGDDSIMLVLPADHVIKDKESLINSIEKASNLCKRNDVLVTFGIIPSQPRTGYGYIKSGKKIDDGFYKVDAFIEKPNLRLAEQYVESGEYSWNSGIFIFKASHYIEQLKKYAPSVLKFCEKAYDNSNVDLDFRRIDSKIFAACPSISIDVAVMEKTEKCVVHPLDVGWNDIGSWSALWEQMEKSKSGNATKGNVMLQNVSNSLIMSESKLIACLGVDNIVLVETDDSILLAKKDDVEDVKTIVNALQAENRPEANLHRKVYRPWGFYDSIETSEGFQVKRLVVYPGAQLSLQMHHHRAEHWVVVKGAAEVVNGEDKLLLRVNESTYIPVGAKHQLANPGKVNLELIEVQSGDYLGEDDIIRFEDRYGRV